MSTFFQIVMIQIFMDGHDQEGAFYFLLGISGNKHCLQLTDLVSKFRFSVIQGHVSCHPINWPEKITDLIKRLAEPLSGFELSKAQHWVIALFNPSVALLNRIGSAE